MIQRWGSLCHGCDGNHLSRLIHWILVLLNGLIAWRFLRKQCHVDLVHFLALANDRDSRTKAIAMLHVWPWTHAVGKSWRFTRFKLRWHIWFVLLTPVCYHVLTCIDMYILNFDDTSIQRAQQYRLLFMFLPTRIQSCWWVSFGVTKRASRSLCCKISVSSRVQRFARLQRALISRRCWRSKMDILVIWLISIIYLHWLTDDQFRMTHLGKIDVIFGILKFLNRWTEICSFLLKVLKWFVYLFFIDSCVRRLLHVGWL